MYINDIKIVHTTPCLADETKYKAITRTDRDLTELLPYLNAVLDKPNYQESAKALMFKDGVKGITLRGNEINITRYANSTELRELLDWITDLINDTYESKEDITPNFKSRTLVPAFKILSFLPKTNCGKCGVPSCMAFATLLNKLEADYSDCPVILEPENQEIKAKLIELLD